MQMKNMRKKKLQRQQRRIKAEKAAEAKVKAEVAEAAARARALAQIKEAKAAAKAQASKAAYTTEEVRAGDIVLLMSDGPGDCLRLSEICELVTVAYDRGGSPSQLAERIVNAAILSGKKVDDMSCVVGFVKEKDLKRKWNE